MSRAAMQTRRYLSIPSVMPQSPQSLPRELIAGARDKRDLAGIDSLIATCPVEHIDAPIGLRAYDLLKRYAKSDGLRTFDSLIAATAMERGFVLASRNRKHFAMIEGLQIEVPRF